MGKRELKLDGEEVRDMKSQMNINLVENITDEKLNKIKETAKGN